MARKSQPIKQNSSSSTSSNNNNIGNHNNNTSVSENDEHKLEKNCIENSDQKLEATTTLLSTSTSSSSSLSSRGSETIQGKPMEHKTTTPTSDDIATSSDDDEDSIISVLERDAQQDELRVQTAPPNGPTKPISQCQQGEFNENAIDERQQQRDLATCKNGRGRKKLHESAVNYERLITTSRSFKTRGAYSSSSSFSTSFGDRMIRRKIMDESSGRPITSLNLAAAEPRRPHIGSFLSPSSSRCNSPNAYSKLAPSCASPSPTSSSSSPSSSFTRRRFASHSLRLQLTPSALWLASMIKLAYVSVCVCV